MPRFLASLVLVLTSAAIVEFPRAEVVHGFHVLSPTQLSGYPFGLSTGSLDFSTQSIVTTGGDLNYLEEEKTPGTWYFHTLGGAVIVSVTAPIESVQEAPAMGGAYWALIEEEEHWTYVIKTADGLYAKAAVREFYDGLGEDGGACCSLLLEYYVQLDGTPIFGPAVPVRTSTWGAVKALYR